MPQGFWLRPYHRDAACRRKLLRKQIFACTVLVLGEVARHGASVIVGAAQGAVDYPADPRIAVQAPHCPSDEVADDAVGQLGAMVKADKVEVRTYVDT